MHDKEQFPLDEEKRELDRIKADKADRKRNSTKTSYSKRRKDNGFKIFPSKLNKQFRGRITENLRLYI